MQRILSKCIVSSRLFSTTCKTGLCPRVLSIQSIKFNVKQYSTNFINMQNEAISSSLFNGIGDRYKGITVDSSVENCDLPAFPEKLKESLSSWIDNGKRGIWFKVHLKDSGWIPILTENGFNFHHAREGFVMLYKWLPKIEEPCNIPPYAHTNLGVGAVVINEQNQVLVVREKYFEVPHWKLPGGYVERGEDIIDAAVREVKEETGIDANFHSIVAFRHAHKMMFGNSDIYMIVNLIPTSFVIKQCERELVGCVWMDVQEYLNHPHVHILNKNLVEKSIEYNTKGIKFSGKKDVYKLLTMEKEFTYFTINDL